MADEEVQGVKILHQALKESPMDYVMLDTQAEFLLKKALAPSATPEQKDERLRMALGCADRSTTAAPSEFGTWARLAQVYVAMEDWENALTILNSCPMFTYQDKDAPAMPEPKDVFLPTLPETRLEEIDSENETRYAEQVDPSLLNLRAAMYKGTFKHAYAILTEMAQKIGWDQLLKIRSTVFVMEDEYRTEKNETTQPTPSQRNPSTDGLRGTPDPTTNGDDSEAGEASEATQAEAETSNESEEGAAVEKPSHAIDPNEIKADPEAVRTISICDKTHTDFVSQPHQNDDHLSKLNNKRLCERWLDSLFMVLYEDLRVYTIWRTQMAQFKAQSMQYRKSPEEWEILGSLAERLQHTDEAMEAYRACLAARFSPKALSGICRGYQKRKDTRETVAAIIRLVTWQYRWYSEFSPELLHVIRTLIENDGAVKVRSIIQASSMPQPVLDLTHHYAALCATFRSSGTDG